MSRDKVKEKVLKVNSPRPLLDSDSQLIRQESANKISRLLKRLDIDSLSIDEKIQWLKDVTFADFMKYIHYLNGKILGHEKRKKWTGSISKGKC